MLEVTTSREAIPTPDRRSLDVYVAGPYALVASGR